MDIRQQLIFLHKKELIFLIIICLIFVLSFTFALKTIREYKVTNNINQEKRTDLINLQNLLIFSKKIEIKNIKENKIFLDLPFSSDGIKTLCSYYREGLIFIDTLKINNGEMTIHGLQVVQE